MKQLQNQLNAEVSILIVVLLSIQCITFSSAINSDQASCSTYIAPSDDGECSKFKNNYICYATDSLVPVSLA